ncbi:hypothetical protein [Streptomyces sp. EN23]|uniref:hypothetical protein n=1 Tax=Streptomyces sp. EN23 TaxID=212774 RepID=UPI000851D957|nr:hypothetical protein [Streptomyces sp. EN23]
MGETPTGTGTAAPAAPTRIFLPDAHEVVRRGRRDLLESEADRVVEHRHVRGSRGQSGGCAPP